MKEPLPVDKNLLKSVSRSFYTSLSIVPPDVRDPLSLAYLICRTADTIADTEIIPPMDRSRFLLGYRRLFDTFPVEKVPVENFQKELSSTIAIPPTAEGRLLGQLSNAFAVLNSLSNTDQALIQEVVRGVIDGMIFDLKVFGFSANTLKALVTEADLERYLHLIGGEPGRYWIRTCLEHFPALRIVDRAEWIHDGIQYGKGLQLVNILRDLPTDLKNGRCYIPQELLEKIHLTPANLLDQASSSQFIPLYHQLIDQALNYLEHGLSTLVKIPTSWMRLRASMWWPLILGLQTLAKLRTNPNPLNPNIIVKITRHDVYKEMIFSLIKLPSNGLLRVDFNFWKERAGSTL